MSHEDVPLTFPYGDCTLFGVLHRPHRLSSRGVLVVVGGPQYRVGSHRQFVRLGRSLATEGIPVFRFDYRGMGDSDGNAITFEDIEGDIGAAVDVCFGQMPDLEDIVLWGLCDGASAACFYAPGDDRVTGLVLVNPWVHSERGAARAHLRHYYLNRLKQTGFWEKVVSGRFDYRASIDSLARMVRRSVQTQGDGTKRVVATTKEGEAGSVSLPDRMAASLESFQGRSLVILSGRDLTADEFRDVTSGSRQWKRILDESRISRRDLAGADHTFSRREWCDQVSTWTLEWLRSW